MNVIEKMVTASSTSKHKLASLDIFPHWAVACSHRHGMAVFNCIRPENLEEHHRQLCRSFLNQPVSEVCHHLFSTDSLFNSTLGFSCLNSCLPVPEDLFYGNAIDPFSRVAQSMTTCFIGRFRQGKIWKTLGFPVDTIELAPQDDEIHWEDSHKVLKKAGLVFITGLTLINHTFEEVIRRTPSAYIRVLLGPSAPLSPVMFDCGIDLVGSTLIKDQEKVFNYFSQGGNGVNLAPENSLEMVNYTVNPKIRELFSAHQKFMDGFNTV